MVYTFISLGLFIVNNNSFTVDWVAKRIVSFAVV